MLDISMAETASGCVHNRLTRTPSESSSCCSRTSKLSKSEISYTECPSPILISANWVTPSELTAKCPRTSTLSATSRNLESSLAPFSEGIFHLRTTFLITHRRRAVY